MTRVEIKHIAFSQVKEIIDRGLCTCPGQYPCQLGRRAMYVPHVSNGLGGLAWS